MFCLFRFLLVAVIGGASLCAAERAPRHKERAEAVIAELRATAATNGQSRERVERWISEINAAQQNNLRSPVPPRIDVFELPFVHYRYTHGKVGGGTKPATNLQPARGEADLSKLDPLPSTFWQRPANIASQDLTIGFGRRAAPRFDDRVWNYAAPKTSYGGHAGFEAEEGGARIKVKFGELHSEPFAARVFYALGYHVEPTDFAPSLKVRYDRKLFTEFNSRKEVNTRITAFGFVPIGVIRFQPAHDPFQFLTGAALKSGERIGRDGLRDCIRTNEATIDFVITGPANVQVRDATVKSIGPWDTGQLGHEQLREVRSVGLLAAWIGWYDARFDNTRLKITRDADDALELQHFFSDLGGGLGKSTGWFGWHGEDADAFADTFTRPEMPQGRGRMTIPFRVVNYRPIEPVRAFEEMTVDDARWMARIIAQLRDEQIAEALRASGFSEERVQIFARKLCSRRDKMLRDLAL
jgi:hypothetical protein